MEIGRYLLLIISLAGLTLNDNGRFSDEGELFFNWEISHYNYLGN